MNVQGQRFVELVKAQPAVQKEMKGVWQFDLGDSKFFVTIKPDSVEATEGKHDKADVVITTTEALFTDLLDRRVEGQMAFLDGRLKVKGAQGMVVTFFRKVVGKK